MKSINNELFGKVLKPASFSELIKIVTKPHNRWKDRVYMWRGQGNIEWPIHSSAYRRLSKGKKHISEYDLINYEKRLLEQASHKGFRVLNNRELNDFELLARLQHHGAATRLVDFTRSITIALWYTCFSSRNKTGALFGFHSAYVSGYEGEIEIRNYKEIINDAIEDSTPITWEPTIVSNRIAAQHSQFLYSKISTAKSGSLCFPENPDESLLIFAITPKVKDESLEVLEQLFDIKHHTLFPDIDGFGQANNYNMPHDYMFRW